jgi:gamma-glutamylaminecyclotransferase
MKLRHCFEVSHGVKKEKVMADKTKQPVDKGMIRVFVYGTLKKGHCNHVLLREANAHFIGYDSITGPYNMYDIGAIPAVVDSKSGTRKIRGQLYAMQPEGLASLDMLEGHPNLYKRRKLWTDVHDRRAWVYFLNATNWLHEDAKEVVAQLWQADSEESRFWLSEKSA